MRFRRTGTQTQAEAERETAPPPRPRGTPRRKGGRSGARGLAAHPAFVPLVGAWGAALAGLAVFVLPFAATARIAMLTGLSAFEHAAHFILAALAALVGGALAVGIARALSHTARRSREIPIAAEVGIRPLHPVRDLGSESFDAPIETMPLGMAAGDWVDGPADGLAGDGAAGKADAAEQPDAPGSAIRRRLSRALDEAEAARRPSGTQAEPAPEPEPRPEPEEEPVPAEPDGIAADSPAAEPLALDLAQFGALPGRNAVWVEGALPEELARPAPAPAAPDPRPAPIRHQPAATLRLREMPAEELSLIQMVERLAAALHERQAADHGADPFPDAPTARPGDRDAALAEALKALGMLAGDTASAGADGAGDDSDRLAERGGTGELRAALAKLHDMRGAA